MPFDTLITNATVVDGTNTPRYGADVGLEDGKIAAIGQLIEAEAGRTIDASGLVLAPGFIDMHTHSDLTLLDDPGGESMAYQGVTTQVTGNCSYSPFPMGDLEPEELLDHAQERMAYFMVPRFVEFVPALPKTPTEKVEKYKLRMEGNQGITPDTWDREKAGYKVKR